MSSAALIFPHPHTVKGEKAFELTDAYNFGHSLPISKSKTITDPETGFIVGIAYIVFYGQKNSPDHPMAVYQGTDFRVLFGYSELIDISSADHEQELTMYDSHDPEQLAKFIEISPQCEELVNLAFKSTPMFHVKESLEYEQSTTGEGFYTSYHNAANHFMRRNKEVQSAPQGSKLYYTEVYIRPVFVDSEQGADDYAID